MNIYEKLKKPILSLAPMEDVTDTVFRQVVMSVGRPDLFYTEFVNVEGLNSKGRDRVIHRLRYNKNEKPIIAQLWGVKPENFLKAAELVKGMGFNGVDINMGCSVKNVVKNNAGSGLIREERGLVKEIIEATKEGAKGLPVSVKTRLGFDEVDIEGWVSFLLDQSLNALTFNMRTARGEESINADWSYMDEIIKIRNEKSQSTLIFGNGDIKSLVQAKSMVDEYRVDGVMIGRAAITNPWIFSSNEESTKEERLKVFKKHLLLFKEAWGEEKDFHSLKKFFRAYINDFDGANELRTKLMTCSSVSEIMVILDETKLVK
jgi:nifR3 family TIM-barrel protein